ncbi:MAG: DUF4401 domain-containing protein, partial [Gammaproteobacteria bacterium]|nr:DUF4401 domain-containing protein [Gammaproteobacteria bacterium]
TTLSMREEGLRYFLIIMGVCSMAAGAYVHRGHMALFARQFALALSLGGQAMVIGGLLFDSPSLYLLTGVSLVMTVVLLPLFRDRLHQFASTALTCFLLTLTLFEESVPHPVDTLTILTLPPALALLLWPPKWLDMRPAAVAMLLTTPFLFVLLEGGFAPHELQGAWAARTVYVIGLILLLGVLKREAPDWSRELYAATLVVVALGLLTTTSLLAALLLLLLAFVLGSWPLATLGTAAQVLLLSKFYYDLDLDLMTKSMMLVTAGMLLLILLWLLVRAARRRELLP